MQQNITQSVFPNILTEKDYTIPVFIGIAKRVFTESPININTNDRKITLSIPEGYVLDNDTFNIKLTYWKSLTSQIIRQTPLPTTQQEFTDLEISLTSMIFFKTLSSNFCPDAPIGTLNKSTPSKSSTYFSKPAIGVSKS